MQPGKDITQFPNHPGIFLQITKIRQLEQYVFGMQFVKMGGERSIVTVKDRQKHKRISYVTLPKAND